MRRNDLSPAVISRARILIVDDQEANVRLLDGILRRQGYTDVIGITDPREAAASFADLRPDLLLLDLHMPHLDGFRVLARLRPMRDGERYLPVLVLTADVSPAVRRRALAAGAEDFLTKPFDADEVALRVRNLLETRLLYRELERRNIELAAEVVERSDEAREAVAARAAILTSLSRLQPGASLEQTAGAICAEFSEARPFELVSVVAFDERGAATILASAGRGSTHGATDALDEAEAARVHRRAALGAWYEPSGAANGPLNRAAPNETRWFAPLESDDEVVGVLTASTAQPVDELHARQHLAQLTEFAAIARALLVPALTLRSHESSTRGNLLRVIATRAFRPVFQPIVDLRSGVAIGFEALTRFHDGVRPDVHFGQAERMGLGTELEEATIHAALADADRLPRGSFVSVNVSPALLLGESRLADLLSEATRPVVLEITEHIAIADYEGVRRGAEALRPRVRLAIDDAGAGFASLRHILELRPDFVKIDRALIHSIETDPSRQALVTGMRYFAEKTSCALLAEGVETAAERDRLRKLGIEYAQGYLFGKPAPADAHAAARGVVAQPAVRPRSMSSAMRASSSNSARGS